VHDPFETASPLKPVSRIAWNEWPMRIELPDLGAGFAAIGLNDGNGFHGCAVGTTLEVRPGVYLLIRAGVTTRWSRDDKWHHIVLREFVAPAASFDQTYVLHQPLVEASAGRDLRVTATVAAAQRVREVNLVAYLPQARAVGGEAPELGQHVQPGGGNTPGGGAVGTGGATIYPMKRLSGFEFAAEIPGDQMHIGTLRYHIVVVGPDGCTTFPSGIRTFPTNWDFFGNPWQTRIVSAGAPILLFDAAVDCRQVTADHRDVRYDLVPSDRPGTTAVEVIADDLAAGEHDHSFRFFCRDKIRGRAWDLGAATKVVLFGRSATDQPCPLQVALVTADGLAYGGRVTLQPRHGTWTIPVSELRQVRAPNIPHGYPVFIPFWSSVSARIPLDLQRLEGVLVSIGPGISPANYGALHGVQIERIWLE
jgi:hypothetical protein